MTSGRRLQLAWADYKGRIYLRVSGWTEAELRTLGGLAGADLSRRLAVLPGEVVAAGSNIRALQPYAGRFEIDEDALCFIPRFPLLEGGSYSLLVYSLLGEGGVDDTEVLTIRFPHMAQANTTRVVAIYPSADVLPVNQLKLYVHFSSPMSEGWAARAIHVRRADNDEPLHGVFIANGPELWDPERRRLTLMLDPGRIKRGLVPNLEAGYPLIEGVPIFVSIDPAFRDAAGRPLRTAGERRYDVGPPVRARVAPQDWECYFPAVGSSAPLTVEFHQPLDHALLEHSLWVNDDTGAPLAGRGSIGAGEGFWQFEPQSPWQEGRHVLDVDPRLEDLAGNSITRVFDRDLMRIEDAPAEGQYVSIEFTCGQQFEPLRTKNTI